MEYCKVKDLEKLEDLKIIKACTKGEKERLFNEAFPRMPKPPSWVKETIDGQPVIIVSCTDEMVEFALDLGNFINKAAKVRKLKEYLTSNPEWRRCGFMGQFAVELYFSGDWTAALERIPLGKADSGDMKLGNFIINIMTRAQLFKGEDDAIIDKKRFKRKPYPLYIACSRAEDKVIIWGYARWDEVKHWNTKSYDGRPEAYSQNVNALHPIEELKELIPVSLSQ
jgi:hypothetical protein